jgi:hypothetical protein
MVGSSTFDPALPAAGELHFLMRRPNGNGSRAGSRGLPGGSSLARLLARERDVPNKQDLPRLTVRQILI